MIALYILYNLTTFITYPLSILFFLLSKRGRALLIQRLGVPPLPAGSFIWLHAASVGEVKSISKLVTKIKNQDLNQKILLTTTSASGLDVEINADIKRLIPIDSLPFLFLAFSKAKFKYCIINETEIWPGLISYLNLSKIPWFIVNGRISDRSFPKYKFFKFILKCLLNTSRFIFAGSSIDQDRFLGLGVDKDKVQVVGNTKYDFELSKFENVLNNVTKKIITFGSIHPEELPVLASVIKTLNTNYQIVLALRHPEKRQQYIDFFNTKNIDYTVATIPKELSSNLKSVVFVDTLGNLDKWYQASALSVVCGTFIPIGGHNIVEPILNNCAVIIGQYHQNVIEVASLLQSCEGLIIANNPTELESTILDLLENDDKRQQLLNNGLNFVKSISGTKDKILDKINQCLN